VREGIEDKWFAKYFVQKGLTGVGVRTLVGQSRHRPGHPHRWQRTAGLGVAKKHRAARNCAGLAQMELARKMGTTQPVVARMEGGRVPTIAQTLGFIRQVFGVNNNLPCTLLVVDAVAITTWV